MGKILKIKLILNKANNSATVQIPKKKIEATMRKKIDDAKFAFIKFEGFE